MSKEVQGRLIDCLKRRSVWEQRQRIWYEMLHDGVGRRSKPFPGAANLHLPLADNALAKMLPYDINAVFSRQLIASFTPIEREMGEATAAAAECLDWKLRKESNFPKEYAFWRYLVRASGRAIMKVRWDAEARGGKGALDFEAIDPLYFIAESEQDSVDDMELFCHVKQISVARYKRTAVYRQDLVELLKGGNNEAAQWKEQEKEQREGLTSTTNTDLIILWECWEKVEEGYLVRTFGPGQPDKPVRPEFIFPVKWQGQAMQPFVSGQSEMGEKGWYASRGIPEKVAPYEAYGTKLWNQKADWLEYCNKPLFTRDPQAVLTNTGNLKLAPGDALPPGISPAAMPPPPFVIDQEMNLARQLAEESAMIPDFGVSEDGKQDTRTATEMQYIGSFASQGIQHQAWVSSIAEGEIYKRAWALLVAFGGKELTYFSSRTRKVLPQQALHDNYLIEPDSLPDAVNKESRIKREFARFQLLRNDPRINQDELYNRFLSAEDPRIAKTLYLPQGLKAATEREDEAIEIGVLMEGYPAAAMPGEDHVTRLQMLYGKLQQLGMLPPPSSPLEMQKALVARQRIQEHLAQHMMLLEQENPAMAKQFKAATAVLDPAQGQRVPSMESGGPASVVPAGDTDPAGLGVQAQPGEPMGVGL